jgi:hypothetical protein
MTITKGETQRGLSHQYETSKKKIYQIVHLLDRHNHPLCHQEKEEWRKGIKLFETSLNVDLLSRATVNKDQYFFSKKTQVRIQSQHFASKPNLLNM